MSAPLSAYWPPERAAAAHPQGRMLEPATIVDGVVTRHQPVPWVVYCADCDRLVDMPLCEHDWCPDCCPDCRRKTADAQTEDRYLSALIGTPHRRLAPLTLQQIFDGTADHLLRQNAACKHYCYDPATGLASAIGAWVARDRSTQVLFNHLSRGSSSSLTGSMGYWAWVLAWVGIANDVNALGSWIETGRLLRECEILHDHTHPRRWAEGLRGVAERFGLDARIVEERSLAADQLLFGTEPDDQ